MLSTADIRTGRPHIVIAGGGVAGLEALLALRRRAPDGVDVTLVSPEQEFSFRAMAVEEPFGGRVQRTLHLGDVAEDLGARYRRDGLHRVDAGARRIELHSGDEMRYDALLLATGARPYPAYTHGVTFDREREPRAFDELLVDVAAGAARSVALVVPEQVGWTMPAYELATGLATFARDAKVPPIDLSIVTHELHPVAAFGASVSRAVAEVLDELDIKVLCGHEPVVVHDEALVAGTHWLTADRIVALPRLAGPRHRGVPCDDLGFVPVDAHGAVRGLDHVYAAGDGTSQPIKQGGLAAQQAAAAVAQLLWRVGRGPQPKQPPAYVLRGVLTTPRGRLHLEASLGPGRAGEGSVATYRPLWRAPGRVASRWLAGYLDGTPTAAALVA
jgi:sulfide:quinone oxidoreductase